MGDRAVSAIQIFQLHLAKREAKAKVVKDKEVKRERPVQ